MNPFAALSFRPLAVGMAVLGGMHELLALWRARLGRRRAGKPA